MNIASYFVRQTW